MPASTSASALVLSPPVDRRLRRLRQALFAGSGTAADDLAIMLAVLPPDVADRLRAEWRDAAARGEHPTRIADGPDDTHVGLDALQALVAPAAPEALRRQLTGVWHAITLLERAGGLLPVDEWLARLLDAEELQTTGGATPATRETLVGIAAVAAHCPAFGLPALQFFPATEAWALPNAAARWTAGGAAAYEAAMADLAETLVLTGRLELDAIRPHAPLGLAHAIRAALAAAAVEAPAARMVGHVLVARPHPLPRIEERRSWPATAAAVRETLRRAPAAVTAEVAALRAGLSERNAEACRLAWEGDPFGVTSYTTIAADLGISRERVRQIVSRTEGRLAHEPWCLPAIARAIDALVAAGGALSTHAWLRRLHRLEAAACAAGAAPATPASLRAIARLGELGIVPAVRFDRPTALWLHTDGPSRTRSGQATAPGVGMGPSGRLRQRLSRTGALSLTDVTAFAEATRVSAAHLLQACFAHESGFGTLAYNPDLPLVLPGRIIRGWYLPSARPKTARSLDLHLTKLLAVAGALSLADIWRALGRRRAPRRLDEGTRSVDTEAATYRTMPAPVLAAVLRQHPGLTYTAGKYALTTPIAPADVLTPLEHAVYQRLVDRGGIDRIVWTERAVANAGFAEDGVAGPVNNAPWLMPAGRGVIALRGHAIDPMARARAHRPTRLPRLRLVRHDAHRYVYVGLAHRVIRSRYVHCRVPAGVPPLPQGEWTIDLNGYVAVAPRASSRSRR